LRDQVVGPSVNQRVAIVVDGVVDAAPVIDPGITADTVEIAADVDRTTAERLAASLAA